MRRIFVMLTVWAGFCLAALNCSMPAENNGNSDTNGNGSQNLNGADNENGSDNLNGVENANAANDNSSGNQNGSVPFTDVPDADQFQVTTPGTTVISTAESWQSFIGTYWDSSADAPVIDFSTQMIIGVFLGGSCDYSGCSNASSLIESVVLSADDLRVTVRGFGVLDDPTSCTLCISPLHLILLERFDLPVAFSGTVPEMVGECFTDSDCGQCSQCVQGMCVEAELAVVAGSDTAACAGASVTLDCVELSGCHTDDTLMVWNQVAGPDVGAGPNAADPLTFEVPAEDDATLTFECRGTLQEATATDRVDISIGVGTYELGAEGALYILDNDSFSQGATITSASGAGGTASQPGGLSAQFASSCIASSLVTLQWECVSGPSGASDCMFVSLPVPGVPADGQTAAGFELLPDPDSDVLHLNPTGSRSEISNVVMPGTYAFRVTALDPNLQPLVTQEVEYNMNTGFDILTPQSSDPVLEGAAFSPAQDTTQMLSPGETIELQFTVLPRTDGTVIFSLRNDATGEMFEQGSIELIAETPAVADGVFISITAPQTAASYSLMASFDSSLGPAADTPFSDTGVNVVVLSP